MAVQEHEHQCVSETYDLARTSRTRHIRFKSYTALDPFKSHVDGGADRLSRKWLVDDLKHIERSRLSRNRVRIVTSNQYNRRATSLLRYFSEFESSPAEKALIQLVNVE
jgi:hypothetical protein